MQVEKRWLIKSGNGFVGIDSQSGYPWLTDFWAANKFISLENALSYKKTMAGEAWQIYECDEIGTRFVTSTATSLFDLELAALKKKHKVA